MFNDFNIVFVIKSSILFEIKCVGSKFLLINLSTFPKTEIKLNGNNRT